MAARLTTAVIQHILFLKNQIPFPVSQLGRLPIPPGSKSSKKRVDLLDAVDTLSLQLHSTFSALSSSLALNSLKYPQKCGHAQVHLLVILGPSLFGPRSRILLTIDGLKIQAWTHEPDTSASALCKDENQCGIISGRPNRQNRPDQVRLPLSPLPPPVTNLGHEHDLTSPKHTQNLATPDPTKLLNPPSLPSDEAIKTHLGERQVLSAAERLLSRSLATACSEGGVTLNAELEPTQTHVLIRAPRRFDHSSWTPRQNMSLRLDSVLAGSRCREGTAETERVAIGTDEIIIRCDYAQVSTKDDPEDVEADELIWWSWDGKIVGFGDL